MENNQPKTRQERREERLEKKRERMPQHGRSLARTYKEAILKQINKLRKKKQERQGK